MTRSEAKEKWNSAQVHGEHFVDRLEALGLIKFNEEKLNPILIRNIHGHTEYNEFDMVKAALQSYGYKIVKDNT